jgi:hypothetical protein
MEVNYILIVFSAVFFAIFWYNLVQEMPTKIGWVVVSYTKIGAVKIFHSLGLEMNLSSYCLYVLFDFGETVYKKSEHNAVAYL